MSPAGTYRFLFFLLSLVCSFNLKAQSEAEVSALLRTADSIYASSPDSSYAIALRAEQLSVKNKFQKTEAKAKLQKGRYFLLKTELENSEKELNAALKIYTALNDPQGQAYVYRLKAILQGRIGNDGEQLQMMQKAVALYKAANDTDGSISVLLNLSLYYLRHENATQTLAVLNDLKASEKQIKKDSWLFYYQNWAKYYHLIKEYPAAIAHFDKALAVAEAYEMKDSYITLITLKAQTYRALNELNAAEKLLLQAEELCINGIFDHELNEAYDELIKVYTAQADYQKAFYYLKRQNDLRQKLYNIERVNSLNALEKKLKLSETEKQLAQKGLEIEHEKLKYEESKSQNVKLLFAIGLIVLVAGFILYLYFKTRSLKDKISEQKHSIEEKSKIIEESYKNIKDSIVYSKQLQDATLPTGKLFQSHFPQSFIYYRPKDIVAGDFYWLERVGDRLFFAVADCTGHGVPGALVSVVCNNALNRAVKELNLSDPGKILDKVRELVIENFAKSEREVKDGMDIALCCFEYNEKGKPELKYAGANSPLWIFRENHEYISNASKAFGFRIEHPAEQRYSVIELPADKQPVGMAEKVLPFTTRSLELSAADTIYAFTDGISDQFGGKEGKKLKRSNFKKFLLSIQELPMNEQQQALSKMFDDWKTGFEQVDDVCVTGIRI